MEDYRESSSRRSLRPGHFNSYSADFNLKKRDRSSPTLAKTFTSGSLISEGSLVKDVHLLPEPKSPYSSLTHVVREIIPQELGILFFILL